MFKVGLFVILMFVSQFSKAQFSEQDLEIRKVDIVQIPDFGESVLPGEIGMCPEEGVVSNPDPNNGLNGPGQNPFPGQNGSFNPGGVFTGGSGGVFDPTNPIGSISVIAYEIMNLGERLWYLIEKGRPVSTTKIASASALPKGIRCWTDLGNWSNPTSKTFRATFSNGMGSKAIEFVYRVLFVSGGDYNGQGKYIAYATILPVKITVGWGYTFDANVSAPVVFNQGSVEKPLAAMQLHLNWSVSTAFRKTEASEVFLVRGDGTSLKVVENTEN